MKTLRLERGWRGASQDHGDLAGYGDTEVIALNKERQG
jgi:hypothetical protein